MKTLPRSPWLHLLTVGWLMMCLQVSTAAGDSITIINRGAVWKYHSQGFIPAEGWMARTHDDSAWTSGPAPLGYGDGDEATVIPSGSGQLKYSASYFRHAFVLTNAAAITGLTINLLRDDGAIVYLNGVPVLVVLTW